LSSSYFNGAGGQAWARPIRHHHGRPAIQFPDTRELKRPIQAAPVAQMPHQAAELAAFGSHEKDHMYPFA
jgi:hypothetical protein